jgi:predicted ATPase
VDGHQRKSPWEGPRVRLCRRGGGELQWRAVPQRLGRYLLLDKIGEGGMAEVFAARLEGPHEFSRACVVKRLRPELARMPQQVQLFLEEARLSALLQHPCVVQVFDVGEADGHVFFAMERIEGPPLSRLLDVMRAELEPLPLEVCAWIGARTAEGLHFAHELVDKATGRPLHIAHRDVSPQNILLGLLGDVKVADFGIAKADVEHRPQTRAGVTKGKLAYMSPEQARGEAVDRRTDVYALGVVLWEMLVGQELFESRVRRRRHEVPAPSSLRAEMDAALDAIVLGALAPRARDRTASCLLVEEALDRWLAERRGAGPRGALQALLQAKARALFAKDAEEQTRPGVPSPDLFRSDEPSPFAADGIRTDAHAEVRADAKTLVRAASADDTGLEVTAPRGVPAPTFASASASPFDPIAVRAGRAAVPLPSIPEAGARLPSASTSFVGRREELARLGALFDEGARLVTLLGPGGTGKTRLALRFAEDAAAAGTFPGGVWFADLTGARDGAAVQSHIARALGVPLRAGKSSLESQAMLGHALAALGRTLVVLDSCDELAGRLGASSAADVVSDLMRRAPRTRLLATSQQLLRAPGEEALHLPPLLAEDAGELFFERARVARSGRALSEAARGVVLDIVGRLDGIPLAIELAAARAATETPTEILSRLGRLGDEVQTLKAAVGETWAQLAEDEKRAFRQASVFRGGFDLEAAEAVFDFGDELGDSPRPVDVLERLKGRSLVVSRALPTGPRYSMLEALRAFATVRLEEAGERGAAEARHAGFYVALGKRLAATAQRLDPEADRRLALEAENLGAIVERAAHNARPSTATVTLALEAALALEPVLSQRASAAEQLALVDKALALAEGKGVAERLRLRAHLARGEARRLLGSFDQARADLHTAIDLAAQEVDPAAEGRALASLGALALGQGKLELADETLARALAVAEEADDEVTAGRVLALLGKVSRLRRRLEEAEDRCRRAVDVSRRARDPRAAGRALVELASTLLSRQQLDEASLSAAAAAQLLDSLEDRRSLVHAWGTLAIIEVDRQRWDDAESAAARAVDLAVRMGERRAHGLYLGMRGAALHGKGVLLEARELYAQAAKELFDAGEEGHGSFFTACLGAVHAALDDLAASERAFAMAQRRLRTAERPVLGAGVQIFTALLELARAGDRGSRDIAREALTAQLRAAEQGPFHESEEVRFAVRIARQAL